MVANLIESYSPHQEETREREKWYIWKLNEYLTTPIHPYMNESSK